MRIVHPATGDAVTDSSTYCYSNSRIRAATMSVRMENVAARKINYKMMVSTPNRGCPRHIHILFFLFLSLYLSLSLSVSLYPPLDSLSRSTATAGAQCACNSSLTSRSSVVRARARVLTWRATSSLPMRPVFALCTIPRLVHSSFPSPSPLPLSPQHFTVYGNFTSLSRVYIFLRAFLPIPKV